MDLKTRVAFTLLLYGGIILGACLSLVAAQRIPNLIRRWWRGGRTDDS